MRRLRVLVLTLLVGSLMVGTAVPEAAAVAGPFQGYAGIRVDGKHPIVMTLGLVGIIAPNVFLGSIEQRATWYVRSARECGSLYPCFGNVTWRTPSHQNGVFTLDHWLTPVTAKGTLSSGVQWRSRTVAAQFRYCYVDYGVTLCRRFTAYAKLVIRSNGTYTGTSWAT